ncbi:MAG TPA: glycosyltransferase, partial [Tepidisphaeraceae bacterium]|nr:glycosyltransferase [Tepidisphaeraceae bacterium]
GCHLGVFPSYSEPWGYTPLEAIVSGVPAVTSDLSGFGAYVQGALNEEEQEGLFVLKRRSQSFDAAAYELSEFFYKFVKLNRRQRIDLRNKVEALSEKFDWQALATHYHNAHDLALSRRGTRSGSIDVKFA